MAGAADANGVQMDATATTARTRRLTLRWACIILGGMVAVALHELVLIAFIFFLTDNRAARAVISFKSPQLCLWPPPRRLLGCYLLCVSSTPRGYNVQINSSIYAPNTMSNVKTY